MRRVASKLLALTTSLFMFFSLGVPVAAEENVELTEQENIQVVEESQEDVSSQENGYDITKPVIEDVIVENNKGTVEVGSSVKVTVKAYDNVGVSNVNVGYYFNFEDGNVEYNSMDIDMVAEKNYEGTIVIPNQKINKLTFTSVQVSDSVGNYQIKEMNQKDYYLNVNPSTGSVEIANITDVTFDKNNQTLTDNDSATLNVYFESSENIQEVDVKVLNLTTNSSNNYDLYDQGNSVYATTFTGKYFYSSANFKVESVIVKKTDGISEEISLDNFDPIQFTVKLTDGERPIVTEFTMTNNGKVLKPGDTVEFSIKAQDDGELNYSYAYLYFYAMENIENKYRHITLTYDETDDAFKGSYEVTENDYPTEWVLEQIYISDLDGNTVSSDTGIFENEKAYSDYYFLVENNGTLVTSTYDVTVTFVWYDKDGMYVNGGNQTIEKVKRRATYKEAGFDFSIRPEIPFEGLNFVGWVDYEGNIVDENTQIVPPYSGSSYSITLYPKYDQNVARLNLHYVDENGSIQYDQLLLAVPEETTYQELEEMLNNGSVELPNVLKDSFSGWEIEYTNMGSNIKPTDVIQNNGYVSINAIYSNKVVVTYGYNYLAKDGLMKSIVRTKLVDKGVTDKQCLEEFMKEPAPNQYEGLRFKGWNTYGYEIKDEVIEDNYFGIYGRAENENYFVRYVLDDLFININGIGATGAEDEEYEYSYVELYEKGESAVIPSSLKGYEDFTLKISGSIPYNELKPGYKFTVNQDVSIFGYGGKEVPVEPENPEEPNEPVKLPDEVVNDIVEKVNQAGDTGGKIQVNMDEATVIPKDVLEAAKGKDVDIELNMGDYTWVVNGKDVQADNLQDINLEVTFDTNNIPDEVVNEIAQGKPVKELSLTHNGDFGFKGKMKFYMGKEYAGQYGSLYYYDSDGRMVFQNAGLIDETGYVVVEFSHASDYVIVVDKKAEVPEQPTDPETPVNPEQPTNPTEPSTEEKNDSNKSEKKTDKKVKTSVNTNTNMYFLFMAIGLGCALYFTKKVKHINK